MVDLSAYKVPIFTGVNDTPVIPTSTKGGNAADLIKRHNDLIDAVTPELGGSGSSSRPSTYHSGFEEFYVNSSTGLDTNTGALGSPVATIAKVLEIIKSKVVHELIYIYLEGTFTNVDLDFTGLYGTYGTPEKVVEIHIQTASLSIVNLSKAEDDITIYIRGAFTVNQPIVVDGGNWRLGTDGTATQSITNAIGAYVQNVFTFKDATVAFYSSYDTAVNGGQDFDSLFNFINCKVTLGGATFNAVTTRALTFYDSYVMWIGNISGAGNTGTGIYTLLYLSHGSILSKKIPSLIIAGNIGFDTTSSYVGELSVGKNDEFTVADNSFKLMTFEGVIATPAIQDYTNFVRALPEYATNLLYVQAQTDSGSCSISVKTSAGVNLYGAVTASTTLLNQAMTTRKVVNQGESITITVSANTSASNLWVRLIFGI